MVFHEGYNMTNTDDRQHRSLLKKIARRVMIERGFFPDFSYQAIAELDRIHGPATQTKESTRDIRGFLWRSIDNDDSRYLSHGFQVHVYETGFVWIGGCRMTNQSSAKRTHDGVLTINGGSSSMKFALYQTGESLERSFNGSVDRIGSATQQETGKVTAFLALVEKRRIEL
jgi:hypothetical protein